VRNTGDDGLAIWSYPAVDQHDAFAWDTVEQPNLANGIAEYGGTDNTIEHDVIADSNALGSGLTISNEQFASPGCTALRFVPCLVRAPPASGCSSSSLRSSSTRAVACA
jgi:hypothetical protein